MKALKTIIIFISLLSAQACTKCFDCQGVEEFTICKGDPGYSSVEKYGYLTDVNGQITSYCVPK